MDFKLFLSTFATLFLAELGDKTQLACVLLTAQSRKPWTVFLGSSLALVSVSLLGVLLADFICNFLPTATIKKVASLGFIVVGLLMFFEKI
ncbi:MAG TPA: hypothetical protein DIT19_00280 [Desulfonauticus sp.]|jgi:putative Ca2+/H+ antiporter (TMEM165/GDT1 family)|nr:MAG: Uncharacterized protein XD41_0194 [Desulfonauticus sp. 38_4375]MDK2920576.1 hypothetical protein [Desulfonauticus sp.]HCO11649.1 hypothetical protein [Desulfonauticus sp.]